MWASGAYLTPSLGQWIRDVWLWGALAGLVQPGWCSPARVLLPRGTPGDTRRPSGTSARAVLCRDLCMPRVFLQILHPVTERTFTKGFLGAKPHAGREHMVSKTASASWSFRTKVGRRTMT